MSWQSVYMTAVQTLVATVGIVILFGLLKLAEWGFRKVTGIEKPPNSEE